MLYPIELRAHTHWQGRKISHPVSHRPESPQALLKRNPNRLPAATVRIIELADGTTTIAHSDETKRSVIERSVISTTDFFHMTVLSTLRALL